MSNLLRIKSEIEKILYAAFLIPPVLQYAFIIIEVLQYVKDLVDHSDNAIYFLKGMMAWGLSVAI